MTDYRAMCAELVDDLEMSDWPSKLKEVFRADIARARDLLAQPVAEGVLPLKERPDFIAGYREGLADRRRIIECEEAERPAAQPVADGEVAELVAWLRAAGKLLHPDYSKSQIPYMRAADLLERLASDNAGLTAAAESAYLDNLSLLDSQND